MADDRIVSREQHRTRIDLREDHEIRYWTKKFSVKRDGLARAVAKAGPSAAAVAKELGKRL